MPQCVGSSASGPRPVSGGGPPAEGHGPPAPLRRLPARHAFLPDQGRSARRPACYLRAETVHVEGPICWPGCRGNTAACRRVVAAVRPTEPAPASDAAHLLPHGEAPCPCRKPRPPPGFLDALSIAFAAWNCV